MSDGTKISAINGRVQGSGKAIDKNADRHAANPGNSLVTELTSHLHTKPRTRTGEVIIEPSNGGHESPLH